MNTMKFFLLLYIITVKASNDFAVEMANTEGGSVLAWWPENITPDTMIFMGSLSLLVGSLLLLVAAGVCIYSTHNALKQNKAE